MTKTKKIAEPSLPEGIEANDLTYPKYKPRAKKQERVTSEFQMYHVQDWGWCILCLLIRGAGRAATARYYAIRIDNGDTVCVGRGPHVTKEVRVYVRESRVKGLQKFLDLKAKGEIEANTTRDHLSTRRMRRFKFPF